MRLFVGNLSYRTIEAQLTELFSQVGEVLTATIVTDRETGRSRGFAFVEMEQDAANQAIERFNGYQLDGRAININEARPRPERDDRYGGNRGGGGQRREPRW